MPERPQIAPERIRPLRRAEYDRLVELGYFGDEKVELLDGFLVAKGSQGPAYASAVRRLTMLLTPALIGRAIVKIQAPLALSDNSEPEPDVAVVAEWDHRNERPASALLVIEFAESPLGKDGGIKAALYASSGIREYWLVHLAERIVEVHTMPADGRYGIVVTKHAGDILVPESLSGIAIRVDDFLN